jgi:ATP-dependent DNA helicase RecQ
LAVPELPGLAAATTALRTHFGFDRFRPAQRQVVASVLAGHDVLAVLPTGGGKSVCFQVPAVVRPGLTLVISPLISLMQDQVEAARRRGLPARFVNSSLDPSTQQAVLDAVRTGDCRLLYVAPERLPRLARDLQSCGRHPTLLAVDEAHCISEWGHDFRPAYRRIAEVLAPLGRPQVVALTGSATPAVRADICRTLAPGAGDRFTSHVASFDRPNLRFGVETVKDDRHRVAALLRLLRSGSGPAIVYAATRNTCESLARILRYAGIRSAPYHAGMPTDRRAEVLRRFLDGDLPAIAATCAFGMGIDKPDVRQVVHWTLPATPESYYQEAGRAGRDGQPARCTLLYHPADPMIHRLQLDVTFPPEKVVERAWRDAVFRRAQAAAVQTSVARLEVELQPTRGAVRWESVRRRKAEAVGRLRALERYARGRGCRRRALIGWFGEDLKSCTGCDRCR